MKKLTMASTVLAASMCLGTQSSMASGSLDDQDMLFAFGAESSIETMMLSEQEMMETEGALWGAVVSWGIRLWNASRPAAIGATTGAVNYTAGWGASQYSDNPQSFSQPQFWSSTVGGAVGGPIGSRWGTAGNIGGGGLGSSVSGYFGNNNYGNNSTSFGQDVSSYCGSCYTGNGTYGW